MVVVLVFVAVVSALFGGLVAYLLSAQSLVFAIWLSGAIAPVVVVLYKLSRVQQPEAPPSVIVGRPSQIGTGEF